MMTRDDDAKMRVVAEYEQLDARISALILAFDCGIREELDEDSYMLLEEQLRVMKHYRRILQTRLENWKPRCSNWKIRKDAPESLIRGLNNGRH